MKRIAHICLLSLGMLAAQFQSHAVESRLVFSRYDQGYWQIWSANTDGSQPKVLLASSSDKRCLRSVPGRPEILYRDNEGLLYLLNLAKGGGARRLLENMEVIKDFDLHPTHGFLISSYAPNANDNIRIWWLSPSAQEKRLLVPEPNLNEMPRWTTTGRAFVFIKSAQGKSQIWRSPFPESKPEPMFAGNAVSTTDPVPSPDDHSLAYCQEGKSNMDLWMARADGSGAVLLYAGPGLEADPCWDPEAQKVYFSTWDGANFRIACVTRSGEAFRYLTPEKNDCRYPAVVKIERKNGP